MSENAARAVIAGLGLTDLGRVFGASQRRLAAAAVRRAVADAGLALTDIDGLLICPGITGGLDIGLATALGLRDLALLAVVNSSGASAVMAVQTAAMAPPGRSRASSPTPRCARASGLGARSAARTQIRAGRHRSGSACGGFRPDTGSGA